ncbi:MAG: isocitrate/isopropylmalate dehydrogenase family protein [Vicinamibacterales bacterium]
MRIAVIAGDGIGPEVTAEALKVLGAVTDVFGRRFDIERLPFGADYVLQTGVSMPERYFEAFRTDFDAILMGALGDPRIPGLQYIRDILLGIRFKLDLYVNYRPVELLDERLCPLKGRTPADVQMHIFRENTEGLYVGIGGRFKPDTDEEIAVQEEVNTYKGVRRIIVHAFEYARAHGLTKVCMADKSNAITHGHALWQRVFKDVAAGYPDIEPTHMYIDALTMFMVNEPQRFQVIVTNNLFGDIITDLGATLQGGLGMAASANVHPGRTSMFEPVHGSAPPLAGKNVANPIGAILSMALMLDHLGLASEARAVERAVALAVRTSQVTAEIGGSLGTDATGSFIADAVRRAGADA